jgi:6-phosphogluconate dehydrogenase
VELGMIGLGKMGLNMATRLVRGGHKVLGFDPNDSTVEEGVKRGIEGAKSLQSMVTRLKPPRIVWCMVPSGNITEETIETLGGSMEAGDTIVDGGNSNYHDSIRRAEGLAKKGVDFIDCGTSGGVWGLEEGYSMMVGGKAEAVKRLAPIFETLAPGKAQGWGYVGTNGAGHFVKMVHNGIEYGMMEAIAEGFSIMRAKEAFDLDLEKVAQIWRYGSVVRSWLLDLTARALEADASLSDVEPWVADSGEGRWTILEAIDQGIPAPVIGLALQMRFASRDSENYTARLLASMRNQFGGHAIKKPGG